MSEESYSAHPYDGKTFEQITQEFSDCWSREDPLESMTTLALQYLFAAELDYRNGNQYALTKINELVDIFFSIPTIFLTRINTFRSLLKKSRHNLLDSERGLQVMLLMQDVVHRDVELVLCNLAVSMNESEFVNLLAHITYEPGSAIFKHVGTFFHSLADGSFPVNILDNQ